MYIDASSLCRSMNDPFIIKYYLLLNLRCAVNELVRPEFVYRILDEFDERNEETPRMRPVDDKPLQKHPRDLLLYRFRVGFSEQV